MTDGATYDPVIDALKAFANDLKRHAAWTSDFVDYQQLVPTKEFHMPVAKKPADATDLDLTPEDSVQGPIHETVTLQSGLKTPDITPAQIVGMIPLIADAAHAFGIFTLSQPQQDSLSKLVTAGIALFGADAIIRLGRSLSKRL